MDRLPEFDWCDFCQNDDWSGHGCPVFKCGICGQRGNEIPTEFEEKASVTAYRKAVEKIKEGGVV